jgi:hypothetical protein
MALALLEVILGILAVVATTAWASHKAIETILRYVKG